MAGDACWGDIQGVGFLVPRVCHGLEPFDLRQTDKQEVPNAEKSNRQDGSADQPIAIEATAKTDDPSDHKEYQRRDAN